MSRKKKGRRPRNQRDVREVRRLRDEANDAREAERRIRAMARRDEIKLVVGSDAWHEASAAWLLGGGPKPEELP